MNKFESVTKSLRWFVALLLVVFVAGCGSSSDTPSPLSSVKALTSFTVGGLVGTVVGTVDEPAKTVALTMPYGTDVTALIATFTTTGASVKVGTTIQTSATTANDFTGPVTYTVTADDGTTAAYIVTVNLASATAKAITAYSFAAYPAAPVTINEVAKTIAVTVPYGTNVTALVATFTTTGASVSVASVAQVSGTTANNFTTSKAYVVTAGDTTTATYTVTVSAAANSAKAITAYSLVGYPGAPVTIDEAAKTIVVTVPYGTTVTALVATFTTTGTGVPTVAGVNQVSGTTPNNFTTSKAYLVTAADSSTATYTVTVAFAANTAKAITAYSFVGYAAYPGVITEPAHTIAVALPSGSVITSLTATFTSTGTGPVTIGGVTQVSGAAPTNDFTTTKSYLVTAADSTTATYVVTVTVAPASTTALPGIAGTMGANATNPTVNSAIPSNGDTNVPTSTRGYLHTNLVDVKVLDATFNEPMDPATIISASPGDLSTFTLKETIAGTNVPGTVAMNAANTIATFSPSSNLAAGISYTATISTAAMNASSTIAIPKAVEWSFTTRAVSAANQASPFVGQAPIDLLTAGNFAILAQTAITETGTYASVITGNAGLSSGAASAIGIHCEEMVATYTIYGVDAGYTGSGLTTCFLGSGADITLVNNAVADKNTAYGEAAARTLPDATNLGVADLSGLTFYPGLYKYTSAIAISTNVTLDAQGDTNAVWIFQISGDLTVPSSSPLPGIQVILANGAKASNVFWQVAGSSFGATVGTYNTFNGNVLSSLQVILQTGAVMNGRALAGTQVVLDANPVTKPAP